MPRADSAKQPCSPGPPRGLFEPRCSKRLSTGRSPTSRRRLTAWLSQQAGTRPATAQRSTGRRTTISFRSPIARDGVVMCWELSWRSDSERQRTGGSPASTIARGFMTEDIVAGLNALPGWAKEMGIVILTATPDEVTCALEVGQKHHQGYGIIHG